ncbi:MAG: glycosyltransferase family 2 protein [Deltaproteobacteria bacterium]|nr:glycosyltransferase family 2 protein [Deltaproteobacteria bacterium]
MSPISKEKPGAEPANGVNNCIFEISHIDLAPGWYMVELKLRSAFARGIACLIFDHGAGVINTLTLPFLSGRMSKRLFRLTSSPCTESLGVKDGSDVEIEVEHLRFVPVPGFFARSRMLRRLRNRIGAYHELSNFAVWQKIKQQAKAAGLPTEEFLQKCYDKTFIETSVNCPSSYKTWITLVEAPDLPDEQTVQAEFETIKDKPTISIVMPVSNAPEEFLRRAIESVLRQSYPNWQLCIADDASAVVHVENLLNEYAASDERIRVAFRKQCGHISEASNTALSLADGEWVAFLDHDDELAEHALFFMVMGVRDYPAARVIYSDEDKIDEEGRRFDPLFKPDWNPDLFMSQNYVGHLALYQRKLVTEVGGFRSGVEGSQDQDLLLRCLAHLTGDEIVHVPRVLYHWRVASGSTALSAKEKGYTMEAGLKALRDYFSTAPRVAVEGGLLPNTYRVRYPLPDPAPLVSLLIPTRDRAELLKNCVGSILAQTDYPNFEILILDNGSSEAATLAFFDKILKEDSRVSVIGWHHPFNFSAINNFGVQQAEGEIIGLINNDIEVISPGWLTEMVRHAVRPEIGCVGAKLYFADGTLQHAGVILGIGGVAGHSHKYFGNHEHGYFGRLKLVQNLSAVTGACLVVRKEVYLAVGGFDEENLTVAFNDVDFCLKVREAGLRNLWTPYAELNHYESQSRGFEDTPAKQVRFHSEVDFMRRKWGSLLDRDPMYSPHLSRVREDFSLDVLLDVLN